MTAAISNRLHQIPGQYAMRSSHLLSSFAILAVPLILGCNRSDSVPPDGKAPPTWVEEGIEHNGMAVSLGYRGDGPSGGNSFEPVAMITRDGTPVASAMVFNALVSAKGSEPMGDEMATVYELSDDRVRGQYAQGDLELPAGAQSCHVRFRIVFAEEGEAWVRDVEIPLN